MTIPLPADPHDRPRRRWRGWRGWRGGLALALGLLLAAVAAGEWAAWPFLAGPLERSLSARLERRVSLSAGPFGVRFIGGLHVSAAQLAVAAPAWSQTPHMLLAHGLVLDLRYIDLWRAWRGQPLRIERLVAADLDGHLERLADGRASWVFGPAPAAPTKATAPLQLPTWGELAVTRGTVTYVDTPLRIDVVSHLSLHEEGEGAAPTFRLSSSGHYDSRPLVAELISDGKLRLAVTVGRATLGFVGTVGDPLHLGAMNGRFSLKGPSLAAVGDPLGVTLPTTGPFYSAGALVREGQVWQVTVDEATIGSSRLDGSFRYDAGRAQPLLTGRLGGPRLMLADLGPVVGTTPVAGTVAAPAAASASASASAPASPSARKGKVLPARPFDLAALRAMDADVLIDVAEIDLNTPRLEPLRPLRAHLRLAAGVLALDDIEASTGQGRLNGKLRLDGRGSEALWDADLRWSGVELGAWIHQARAEGAPPYITGRMKGSALLQGQGRSTAGILGSLKGRVQAELQGGTMSHLIVEAAGLDLAQALGVLVKGDDALPVQCAVMDLRAEAGVFRPQLMVLDNTDSALWVDGSLSLASEALDLRVVVSPKDFSPLSLRSPLQVRGSFAQPEVSIEKGPVARKLGASLLLGLLNPLAALIPLIDTGNSEAAARSGAGCRDLVARHARAVKRG